MKNLLILIVAFAVFLHFYPQPKLENWYEQQKVNALAKFDELAGTKVQLNTKRIADDISKKFNTFRKSERDYTNDVISSPASVKQFYTKHCGQPIKRDKKLSQQNQAKLCQVISRYRKYF